MSNLFKKPFHRSVNKDLETSYYQAEKTVGSVVDKFESKVRQSFKNSQSTMATSEVKSANEDNLEELLYKEQTNKELRL